MPPTDQTNLPVIPASTFAAALKEYEDMDETDSEGDDLSW
jgi:CRISPR/Cas system CMR subunit Cmr4 (Cas7 group RAMP superfamily)